MKTLKKLNTVKKSKLTEITQKAMDSLNDLGKTKLYPYNWAFFDAEIIRFHHRGFYFDWNPTRKRWCYSRNTNKPWIWAKDADYLMDRVNGFCDWVENKRKEEKEKENES